MIEFGKPASYRIVVQGVIGLEWGERLGGLTVVTARRFSGKPRTTLSGRLHDQAELNGVLTTLYGLHLPILLVKAVGKETDNTRAGEAEETELTRRGKGSQ